MCTIVVILSYRGEVYDRNLVHAIESVIIEWSHQIQDVLKKDSAQPLLEGLNPGPLVEIEFWKSKAQNLECIYDQVGLHFNRCVILSCLFNLCSCVDVVENGTTLMEYIFSQFCVKDISSMNENL